MCICMHACCVFMHASDYFCICGYHVLPIQDIHVNDISTAKNKVHILIYSNTAMRGLHC